MRKTITICLFLALSNIAISQCFIFKCSSSFQFEPGEEIKNIFPDSSTIYLYPKDNIIVFRGTHGNVANYTATDKKLKQTGTTVNSATYYLSDDTWGSATFDFDIQVVMFVPNALTMKTTKAICFAYHTLIK